MSSVPIRYSRVFPHPLADVYAWLTDYTDDDPKLTGAVQEHRKVLERDGGRILMEGGLNLLGNKGGGIIEVTLVPPRQWRATLVKGPGRGSVYEYALTELAPTVTRLDVVYHVRAKRWTSRLKVRLARPFVRRELDAMWGGFAASMARELKGSAADLAAPQPAALE